MEQLVYFTKLYDLYGTLLTKKQQECFKMHAFEDFSLSEIGEFLQISRQAVHDNIHRAEEALTLYEEKLGFAKRLTEQEILLLEICAEMEVAFSAQAHDRLGVAIQRFHDWAYGEERIRP